MIIDKDEDVRVILVCAVLLGLEDLQMYCSCNIDDEGELKILEVPSPLLQVVSPDITCTNSKHDINGGQ